MEPPAAGPGDPRVAKGHGSKVQVVVGSRSASPELMVSRWSWAMAIPTWAETTGLATENELTVES